MDGSNQTELYRGTNLANNLVLDHTEQVLYWSTTAQPGEAWSIDVDGSNQSLRMLLQVPTGIHAITVWSNLVFWSDDDGIHSITKDGSSNTTIMEQVCSPALGLAIISKERQQQGE